MTSPFPGMDPYIESPAHWSDFHMHFITALANAINDLLPDSYVARMNEHVMQISPTIWDEPDEATFVPDVTVVADANTTPPQAAVGTEVEAWGSASQIVTLDNVRFMDDYTEAYIEVQRLPEMRVVTVIELFSPTNKYGEGRGIYMRKRREFLDQPVNIVELDLLRAGGRLEFAKPLPINHYYAFISKSNERPRTRVIHWSVKDLFPSIPIPLQPPDVPLLLPLAAPFAAAYHNGRYKKVVKYRHGPPPPSFARSESDWIAKMIEADTTIQK